MNFKRPRVELLYDAAPVHMLIDDLDVDQLRDALRAIALYAGSDSDGPQPLSASAALWAGLAGALDAPRVPVHVQAAHVQATWSAVSRRRRRAARVGRRRRPRP